MKTKTTILTGSALVLGLSLGAISAQANGDIDGAALWEQHCAKCHASDGSGNTKIGKKMQIGDYTDPAVQATFTDEEAVKITLEGYTDESGKQAMKPFGDKLSEDEAKAVVEHIRTFDD